MNNWQAYACHTKETIESCDAEWVYAHSAGNSQWQSLCQKVRSAMLDTGANISLFDKSVESAMANMSASKMQIEVANSETMPGRKDGTLHMFILDGKHASRDGAVFQHQITTVDNLSRELFSVDDLSLVLLVQESSRQSSADLTKIKLYDFNS